MMRDPGGRTLWSLKTRVWKSEGRRGPRPTDKAAENCPTAVNWRPVSQRCDVCGRAGASQAGQGGTIKVRYDLQGLSAVDLCLSRDPRHRSAHRHPFGDAGREVEARRYMEGGKPVGGCPQPPGWATDTTGHLSPEARRALVKRMIGAAEMQPFNVLSRTGISSTMPLQRSEHYGAVKNDCRLSRGVRLEW